MSSVPIERLTKDLMEFSLFLDFHIKFFANAPRQNGIVRLGLKEKQVNRMMDVLYAVCHQLSLSLA
jgi:hypothetical protein